MGTEIWSMVPFSDGTQHAKLELKVNTTDTVLMIKRQLYAHFELPVEQVVLRYKGEELEDNAKFPEIKEGDCVFVWRKRELQPTATSSNVLNVIPSVGSYAIIGFTSGAALCFGYRMLASTKPYSFSYAKSPMIWGLSGALIGVIAAVCGNISQQKYSAQYI